MNDIADHAHRLAGARATQQTVAASAAKVRAEADALEARRWRAHAWPPRSPTLPIFAGCLPRPSRGSRKPTGSVSAPRRPLPMPSVLSHARSRRSPWPNSTRGSGTSRQRCARRSPRVSGLAASMRTVRMPTPWRDTGARPNRCAAPLLRGRCRPLTRPAYRLSPRRSSPNEARFSRKSERHAHRQCAKLLQLNLVAQ